MPRWDEVSPSAVCSRFVSISQVFLYCQLLCLCDAVAAACRRQTQTIPPHKRIVFPAEPGKYLEHNAATEQW